MYFDMKPTVEQLRVELRKYAQSVMIDERETRKENLADLRAAFDKQISKMGQKALFELAAGFLTAGVGIVGGGLGLKWEPVGKIGAAFSGLVDTGGKYVVHLPERAVAEQSFLVDQHRTRQGEISQSIRTISELMRKLDDSSKEMEASKNATFREALRA